MWGVGEGLLKVGPFWKGSASQGNKQLVKKSAAFENHRIYPYRDGNPNGNDRVVSPLP